MAVGLCWLPKLFDVNALNCCKNLCVRYGMFLAKSREACNERMDAGRCEGSFESYYYEKASGTCEPFKYSGCGGTSNRFQTKEQCEEVCMKSQSNDVHGQQQQQQQTDQPHASMRYPQNPGIQFSFLYDSFFFFMVTEELSICSLLLTNAYGPLKH
ncbi:unnamed protein product [Anisakis simplex]|uniref:BPTI/Kunitz inhibitor domain-containing protein n=1 Tax=Anisakis simplex TaxID=6269 RepID=A0A0M3JAI1_ANISI|nr:unnamed protein product [Anisakis simplex]